MAYMDEICGFLIKCNYEHMVKLEQNVA